VLSGSHADAIWLQGFANGSVAENVIGGGWLFDEPRLQFFQALDVVNGLWDIPNLGELQENEPHMRYRNNAVLGLHRS